MNVLKKTVLQKNMIFINLENLQGKKSDKFNKLTEMKKYKLPFLLADY